jgi:hypothetical protein
MWPAALLGRRSPPVGFLLSARAISNATPATFRTRRRWGLWRGRPGVKDAGRDWHAGCPAGPSTLNHQPSTINHLGPVKTGAGAVTAVLQITNLCLEPEASFMTGPCGRPPERSGNLSGARGLCLYLCVGPAIRLWNSAAGSLDGRTNLPKKTGGSLRAFGTDPLRLCGRGRKVGVCRPPARSFGATSRS